MTFPEYFQACQTLITKEIDLPFDCPFPQAWIDESTADFNMYYHDGLTPFEAVTKQFWNIDQKALLTKKRKALGK